MNKEKEYSIEKQWNNIIADYEFCVHDGNDYLRVNHRCSSRIPDGPCQPAGDIIYGDIRWAKRMTKHFNIKIKNGGIKS